MNLNYINRNHNLIFLVSMVSLFCLAAPLPGQQKSQNKDSSTHTNPQQVDADYQYQGEYVGQLKFKDNKQPVGLHVIAMGKGKFKAVIYSGGLPGAGFDKKERYELAEEGTLNPSATLDPTRDAKGVVHFTDKNVGDIAIAQGAVLQMDHKGLTVGKLKKIDRKSKTLGANSPPNAVVLYASAEDVKNWKNGKASEEGFLMQGTTSNRKFGSHDLHIEFLLPYKPAARGQARGNSGIYVQGRWEIQMLDSFGLTGEQNECGGIYSVAKPDINMCLPPLTWQTYDIEFTAAKYDQEGNLKSNARMTVYHNGVVIHDDVELPDRKTTAAPSNVGNQPGPIFLQNHGNPVRYRNIWVLEK